MKKNIRYVHVLGIGMLTPALMGEPHAAAAVSMGPVPAYQDRLDQGTRPASAFEEAKVRLAVELASWKPSEKLTLGSYRVPLATDIFILHTDTDQGPSRLAQPPDTHSDSAVGSRVYAKIWPPRRQPKKRPIVVPGHPTVPDGSRPCGPNPRGCRNQHSKPYHTPLTELAGHFGQARHGERIAPGAQPAGQAEPLK